MREIAIVGLDCRFPGAADARAYWELLMRSGDAVGRVPADRWDGAEFSAPEGGDGRANTDRGGFIDDPDVFDNEFFTISPREAAAMDPQQRLLLQCSWRALEDAGIAPASLAGSDTGVFVGIMGNEWAHRHLTDYDKITAQVGSGNGYCMTANRISYHLDLKGPSLAVDTACSSSLVAVHLAGNALLSGECDTAIAAGVNVTVSPALNIFYTQAGLSAPDGRCKPFSAQADGIGRGEGVGVVVLRRLEDALADGQQVYAVIRATAVNQDGRSNGLTAPNRWAQQAVLEAAYRRAGVEPAEVVFTEGHGTGTELGDMIETKALGALHATRADKPMALGSVKGNLGHTEGAAGVAGLIKVALSLHNRVVPASRFAVRENPKLNLAAKGIKLIKAPLRLAAGTSVAGLSSFGMGGTNAHAVLASAPPQAVRPATVEAPGTAGGVFTLSATTPEALRRNLLAQAEELDKRRVPLGRLCWTSNRVKTGHRIRFALPAEDISALSAALRAAAEDDDLLTRHANRPTGRPKAAFLFAGQGVQSPGMTMRLYRESAVYRRHLDAADAALRPHLGWSVVELLTAEDQKVHRTGSAQPALFAVGYALARTMEEFGVEPALLLGHSVGEYAAAVVADALTLDEAARLIAARGRLMEALPDGGGMLSVFAPEAEILPLIHDEPLIGVAAVNGPRQTVLSGDLEVLDRVALELGEADLDMRRLTVSHAFHSPLMQPMLAEFAEVARGIAGVPRLPFYSTVRGRLLRPGEPLDADYWTEHVSAAVRFADAAEALLAAGPTHVVEIGPQPVLGGLVRRLRPPAGLRTLHPLPTRESGRPDLGALLAQLYQDGLDPHWDALYGEEQRTLTRLAPYAFSDAHRFWVKPPTRNGRSGLTVTTAEAADGSGGQVDDDHVVRLAPAGRAAFRGRVAEKVAAAVAAVGGYSLDELSLRSRLYEDLGFDSVTLMELKKDLEKALPETGEVSVPELIPVLGSLGELIAFYEARSDVAADAASLA
ncbi:type I polyketide synthase [Streptacidiphilus jiangxiensis]|uniref:Acyl transferase domain-containing protein n=1 Tax=Streptacidiphilus jiangxiensis TaxID=235985 RepID=A0A1H7IE24_STRJI|nr:type I polyketide synthase [Streptacidiphilus jiangxiensis]SEK58875.1 Acyl transferase domain-containing protein [Streptacidiphilus jiangxiensis]